MVNKNKEGADYYDCTPPNYYTTNVNYFWEILISETFQCHTAAC